MTYTWGDNRRFYSYNRYLERTFGTRLQKIPIDAGFTCPNRDGTCGTGGCTYCLNAAFNPAYCQSSKSISMQINNGIAFFANQRSQSDRYLAYFQAFSNTHGDISTLKAKYSESLTNPTIGGIVIATRPDCIDTQKLDLLAALQQKTYVALEIGIETLHDATLRHINRGHDAKCTLDAINRIAQYHIPVCGHLIFGLPGENPDTWIDDLKTINHLALNSLKFHQLQIIKGTRMAMDFEENPDNFYPFTFDSYIKFISDYLAKLNPEIAIERLAGEVPPRFIQLQNWNGRRYYELVVSVESALEQTGKWQGADF